MRAARAGTKPPICARITVSATWRISVDLPAMLGPGDDQELLGRRIEPDVVGHEAAARGEPLDHGVAAVGEVDHAPVVDHGPAVARAVRHLGQRRQRVGGGDARRQRQQALGAAWPPASRSAVKISSSIAMRRSSALRIFASNSASSAVTKRSALATVCLRT